MCQHLRILAMVLALGAVPSWAGAEQVRYRYIPVDACGKMAPVAIGPEGTIGELKRGFGLVPVPYPYAVRPNQLVTFRHPFNGRNATIPLRLPAGPQQLEYHADHIVYGNGEYIVDVRFLPDGSVDVIYNSGFLRVLQFD